MESRMEMIYVGNDTGYKTGVGAIFDTNAETYAAFRSAKRLDVGTKDAVFLLDYYNRKGDLADTIGLSASGYERITGEKALTEAQYREIDTKHWDDVRSNVRANRPARGPRSTDGN